MLTKGMLVHRSLLAAAALLGTLLTGAVHADDSKLVPFSELRVTQFYASDRQRLPLAPDTPTEFSDLLAQECSAPVPAQGTPPPPAPPLVAALAVPVLKWIVSSGLKVANKKLAAYIKQHTATYSNTLRYDDLFDSHRWSRERSPRSCIVAQRVVCQLPSDQARLPLAHCESGKPALSFAAELRNEGDHLRVLPLALDVRELKARNNGKEAAVTVQLELLGLGHAESGDIRWSSGAVAFASESFPAKPSKGGDVPVPSTAEFFRKFINPGDDRTELWATAEVLPMPPMLKRPHADPRSVVAMKVTMNEVGDPGTFAKLVSSFLDSESADVTDVLVTAAKDKWGPKED
jgi:hypothetical protein